MEKKIIVCAALILFTMGLSAQEANAGYRMAASLGSEWNMNSRENFAGALAAGFDYNLPVAIASFAAGGIMSGSSNFTDSGVMEVSGLFRWYFLEKGLSGWNFMGKGHNGFFAQADLGLYLIMEAGDTFPLPLAGLRAGYRLPLGSAFFVEPFGRLGYPFAFGIGVLGGYKFGGTTNEN